jgi:hypothetical protein
MKRFVQVMLICVVGLWINPVQAQTTDFELGKLPQLKVSWGRQPVNIVIKNKVDYPKFVVGLTKLSFQGTYLNPKRQWKVNRIIQPSDSIVLPLSLEIPSNFGTANIIFEIYDVVDTVDQISLGTKIFSQNFALNFKIPNELSGYLQEKVTLSPMAGNSPVFDNEFARIVLVMLAEGKPVEEIKKIPRVDSSLVNEFLRVLEIKKYVLKNDQGYKLTFPFLTVKQAEMVKPLIETTTNQLTAIVEKNLGNYRNVLDSLVAAGVAPKDSNDFMNGASILYERYPVISTLFLWYDLGQKFISDSLRLAIFNRTDPCNCNIQPYMYGIQGGDIFNGHLYYTRYGSDIHYYLRFGDSIPRIKCPDLYPFLPILNQGEQWDFEKEYKHEIFTLSLKATQPMMNMLDQGTEPLIQNAKEDLQKILSTIGPDMNTAGSRWWFWNVIASRTLDKLVASGDLTRKGNGQYLLDVTEK